MIDTLIQFSGGLDSAYCAYKYLTENPDKTLLLHHINLINWEGRNKYESVAVKSIMAKFKEMGLDNFVYEESTFDYGTLNKIIYDIEIVAVFTGVIFRNNKKYKDLKNLWIPASKSDLELTNYSLRDERRKTIINTIKLPSREINIMKPISHMTKEEVINALPEDIRKMCWYCRHPTKDGKICGKCFTCKGVNGTA